MGKRSSQNGEWPWATGAHAAAWHEAARMFGRVSSGEDLTPYAPPPGLLLEPGETVFCEGMVEYSRYYGMDVTYTHRSTFAWGGPVFVAAALIGSAAGNAAARGRAERMAVPQWRFEGFPTVLVTRHRLLISHPGHYQWLSFWHSAMIEFGPDVQAYALYLGFPGCAPVMLRGPMVPWLSVVTAALIYPREQLAQLPFFAPLGAAVGTAGTPDVTDSGSVTGDPGQAGANHDTPSRTRDR